MALQHKPGFIPVLVAMIVLLNLAVAYVLLTADRDTVFVEGQPMHMACSFKQHFHVPCPACGMSRAVVMTLHGDVSEASTMNPGGPLGVLTALYFSLAMFWLALRRGRRTVQLIQWSTAALGMLAMVAVFVHWIRAVAAGPSF